MLHDIRQALRTLRKHRGFTVLASLVLGLAIGLNTAIFSIVYAMLFKPLPVEDPASLVSIYQTNSKQPDRPFPIFSRTADFIQQHSGVFSDLALRWGARYPMRTPDGTETVNAELVTSNYFTLLGVRPVLGRVLEPREDDLANPEHALVISDALWRRRFDADPAIVGKTVVVTPGYSPDLPFTIVGVMPPGFHGISEPWRPTHVWMTFVQGLAAEGRVNPPFAGVGLARLRPGVDFRQARAVVAAQSKQAAAGYLAPGLEPRNVVFRTADVAVPDDPSAAVVPVRLAGAMTLVVAMVLLVAATNIAGILTARGVGRSSEIAVRRVLGAAPFRIVRQLLAESLLLAAAGGALGLLIAAWLIDLFRAVTPLQFAFAVRIEWSVALFAGALCVVTGIVVGTIPALQATRMDILPWLAGGGVTQTKRTRHRLRHGVTVPQIAISLALLLIAAMYVRSLMKIELADLGYRTTNIVIVNPILRLQAGERMTSRGGLTDAQYAERNRRFYQQLLQRLQTIKAGRDVAIANRLPLHEPAERPNWSIVSKEAYLAGEREGSEVERTAVSPGYFRTIGIRLLSGRDFDERDTRTRPGVVIVSASAGRRLWPGRNPVGQTLTIVNTWNRNERATWYEVAGVVSDVRPVLQEREARPFVYFALGQEWRPEVAYLLTSSTDTRAAIASLTDAITGSDPLADVRQVQTMAQLVGHILYPRRLAAAILAISGAVALFLATLGIYGVVSYSVAQRRGEIGVRMALGAGRRDIVRLVLGDAGRIAAAGSFAGLIIGYAAIRITASRYLALPALDIFTLLLTPLTLSTMVLLASWLPALRAGRIDPLEVLRRP